MPNQRAVDRNRRVYTSGLTKSDLAVPKENAPTVGKDFNTRRANFRGVASPLPSQKYTVQRGMALAALQLPEGERIQALMEVLGMLGLLDRVMPRWQK